MYPSPSHLEHMEAAKTLLFVPDYFHYLLTGQKVNEYTEATTGQMVSPVTKDWDYELMDMLGYNKEMFCKLVMPGTNLGSLREEVQKEVGFYLYQFRYMVSDGAGEKRGRLLQKQLKQRIFLPVCMPMTRDFLHRKI